MLTNMRKDLKAALKTRDSVTVSALRSALAALANAEAVATDNRLHATSSDHVAGAAGGLGAAETQRRHLSDDEIRSIVQTEVDERLVAVREYENLGRDELAEKPRAEAEVLKRYLAAVD